MRAFAMCISCGRSLARAAGLCVQCHRTRRVPQTQERKQDQRSR